MSIKKIAVTVLATLVLALGTFTVASATGNGQHQDKDHKVGICHATGSKTNPYVFINVDKHAADAHSRHQDGRDKIGVKSKDECPKAEQVGRVTNVHVSTVKKEEVPAQVKAETVTEIPKTGASVIGALLSSVTLGYTAVAYLRSRRSI